MSYVNPDYPTKKAFLEAVKRGVEHRPYNLGLGLPVLDGLDAVEGPHYPKPHKWYAAVVVKNGVIVSAK
jgi:hypothetical protein